MPRTKRHPTPVTQSSPGSTAAEAYHTIRSNIQFRAETHGSQVILVASANPGEGRTTTACNLAVTLSQSGQRVLLVDADMRNPDVHNRLCISNDGGLSTFLSGNRDTPEYVGVSEIPRLQVLTSGSKPENPSPLLSMNRFDAWMREVKQNFDVVLMDCPSILSASDALVISRLVDGVVFVVDAQRTNRVVAQKALSKLQDMGVYIIGGILNRVPKHARKYPIGETLANQQVTTWNV